MRALTKREVLISAVRAATPDDLLVVQDFFRNGIRFECHFPLVRLGRKLLN
jgi:hypothetical protein